MAQQKADQASNQGMIQGKIQQNEAMDQMAAAQQGQQLQAAAMQDVAHNQEMEKIAMKEGAKTERDIIKNQGTQ